MARPGYISITLTDDWAPILDAARRLTTDGPIPTRADIVRDALTAWLKRRGIEPPG